MTASVSAPSAGRGASAGLGSSSVKATVANTKKVMRNFNMAVLLERRVIILRVNKSMIGYSVTTLKKKRSSVI